VLHHTEAFPLHLRGIAAIVCWQGQPIADRNWSTALRRASGKNHTLNVDHVLNGAQIVQDKLNDDSHHQEDTLATVLLRALLQSDRGVRATVQCLGVLDVETVIQLLSHCMTQVRFLRSLRLR
jgi:hypothetical protein